MKVSVTNIVGPELESERKYRERYTYTQVNAHTKAAAAAAAAFSAAWLVALQLANQPGIPLG